MKVTKLTMKSFRGIDDLTLDFDPKVNVLIGVNGIGKSSILECLAILLTPFIQYSRFPENPSDSYRSYSLNFRFNKKEKEKLRIFKEEDINNNSQSSRALIFVNSEQANWSIKRERGVSVQSEDDLTSVKKMTFSLSEKVKKNPVQSIPIIVYYAVSRTSFDISLEISESSQLQQVDAYDQALEEKAVSFKPFFTWFRTLEDLENEERRENSTYRDPKLEAVRKAISSVEPEFSNLRVRRAPLRMTVAKGGKELIIDQLSDGEKCLLAMVGDLARRLAIANPGLSEPLEGEGVVLIDEIELHLHPKWQRDIIPKLTRTFPNCQFIMTTHSPQVVSDVHPNQIYVLESTDNGVIAYHPDSSYGRDSNRILEDLMGVPERPERIKASLHRLFELIDDGQVNEARQLRQQLEQEIGVDEPEFSKADVLIWGQEVLGS